jgi:hypothetical protein
MLALLLAATLSTELPMIDVFRAEVHSAAVLFDIEEPAVKIVRQENPTWDRWAWVWRECDPSWKPKCRPVIYVREDVLAFFGYDSVRVLAFHEMVHVRNRDHLRDIWERTDAAALEVQRKEHAKIAEEVYRHFDRKTAVILGIQLRRWNARWGK